MQRDNQGLIDSLFLAIEAGNVALIADLLAAQVAPLHPKHGYALSYALEKNPAMIPVLLRNGVNDLSKCSPPIVREAAIKKQWDTVRALIEGGREQYNHSDFLNYGDALLRATNAGKIELAKLLLERGARTNWSYHDTTNYALHCAVLNGNQELIALLLRFGADPNAKNKEGQTPLSLAITNGDPELIALMLRCGADPNARNQRGQTPLSLVNQAHSNNPDLHRNLVRLFAQTGAEFYQAARNTLRTLDKIFSKRNLSVEGLQGLIFNFLYGKTAELYCIAYATRAQLSALTQAESTARAEIQANCQADERKLIERARLSHNDYEKKQSEATIKKIFLRRVQEYSSKRSNDENEYRQSKWPLWLRKKCGARSRTDKLAAAEQLAKVINHEAREDILIAHQAALNQGDLGKVYRYFLLNR